MHTSLQKNITRRYDLLDIGRFLAAFSVVMYHFVFKGWTEKDWYLDYSDGDLWKYGFLGVQFFFVISGFVVFMSAKHKSLPSFLASRIARLYPAYWACVLATFFLVWFLTAKHHSLSVLLINLTMLEGFIKVPYIDPVYWSLTYELIFYFWIACFLLFKCSDKGLRLYLVFFLALSSLSYAVKLPNVVIMFFQTVYAPYFIAGICFYNLSERKNLADFSLLLWALLLSLVQVNHQLVELSAFRDIPFSNLISLSIIGLIYVFFLLISLNILNVRLSWAATIGALTYPLYLIHMEIGSALFGKYNQVIDQHLLLPLILLSCIVFSYCVNRYIEKAFSFKVKNFSESIIATGFRKIARA